MNFLAAIIQKQFAFQAISNIRKNGFMLQNVNKRDIPLNDRLIFQRKNCFRNGLGKSNLIKRIRNFFHHFRSFEAFGGSFGAFDEQNVR